MVQGPFCVFLSLLLSLCLFLNVLNDHLAPPERCLPHLARRLIPAVSAFALSWKQQCDRPWVGVRDELVERCWGCVGEAEFNTDGWVRGSRLLGLNWSETSHASAQQGRSGGVFHRPQRPQARCYCAVGLTSNQSTHLYTC